MYPYCMNVRRKTKTNVFTVLHLRIISKQSITLKDTHVQLICGGGSGHEPSHVGYVGDGMLSAGKFNLNIYNK